VSSRSFVRFFWPGNRRSVAWIGRAYTTRVYRSMCFLTCGRAGGWTYTQGEVRNENRVRIYRIISVKGGKRSKNSTGYIGSLITIIISSFPSRFYLGYLWSAGHLCDLNPNLIPSFNVVQTKYSYLRRPFSLSFISITVLVVSLLIRHDPEPSESIRSRLIHKFTIISGRLSRESTFAISRVLVRTIPIVH